MVLEVCGKGAKLRVIPISKALAGAIEEMKPLVDGGFIIRSLNNGATGETISGASLYNLTGKYGAMIGKPELQPHDLRRTYARLGYDSGIEIAQISKLLGHSNIATTQRYLGIGLDLNKTISDFIPF
jgi:integrase/recombinase XerC